MPWPRGGPASKFSPYNSSLAHILIDRGATQVSFHLNTTGHMLATDRENEKRREGEKGSQRERCHLSAQPKLGRSGSLNQFWNHWESQSTQGKRNQKKMRCSPYTKYSEDDEMYQVKSTCNALWYGSATFPSTGSIALASSRPSRRTRGTVFTVEDCRGPAWHACLRKRDTTRRAREENLEGD